MSGVNDKITATISSGSPFLRMILSQYKAAYDDFILNENEMRSLHADGLLLTGTSKQSTVWELLHVRAPKNRRR